MSALAGIGNTRAANSLPACFSSSAGSVFRCRKSSYARRATERSTISASCQPRSVFIAKRLTVAPDGSVIANRPSRTRASGLVKRRCSSVNASGPSTTTLASIAASASPLPSSVVSDSGALSCSDVAIVA